MLTNQTLGFLAGHAAEARGAVTALSGLIRFISVDASLAPSLFGQRFFLFHFSFMPTIRTFNGALSHIDSPRTVLMMRRRWPGGRSIQNVGGIAAKRPSKGHFAALMAVIMVGRLGYFPGFFVFFLSILSGATCGSKKKKNRAVMRRYYWKKEAVEETMALARSRVRRSHCSRGAFHWKGRGGGHVRLFCFPPSGHTLAVGQLKMPFSPERIQVAEFDSAFAMVVAF